MLFGDSQTGQSIPLPLSQCTVPSGINGPVAIFITSDGQPLLNDVHDRSQKQIVAGPTLAFIDTQPQMLPQLVRMGPGAIQQPSTTTQTISPAEASSLISSVSMSAMGTAAPSAMPTMSAAISGSTPGGPSMYTGPSADGSVTVNGWMMP